MSIISLNVVTKNYPLGNTTVQAVKGVTFDIEKGDFISIAGPSGSGKSTILNIIGLMDNPTSGRVRIGDKDVSQMKDREMTLLRHETIGFIFQSFNLIPVLNVSENIEFPLQLGGRNSAVKKDPEWIHFLIERVGLKDHIKHRPAELSGGQRQRVAVARALVTKPIIVLADEPTANLDSQTGNEIIALMKEMNREQKTTFIFSTHDAKIVEIADHVIRLRDGLVTEDTRR